MASSDGGGPLYRNITVNGQSYRLLTVGTDVIENGAAPTSAAIQIAVPLTDIQHSLTDLRLILWLVTFAGMAVGVGLGYVIGRDTIRPVERLTAAAEHVAATQDLDSTIDEKGEDELARLARSFNSMLRALAASRQQQAQLISDAGHELRTPLTSLRTNIEVLIRVKDLPDEDRAELLADVHAQLEEMTTLVGDVVELAREEEAQSEPIEVRLDAIVEHAVERARRRAPTVAFDVAVTPGSIRAHPALLERAVLNVLDNAAKWSPPGGTIRVRLERGERVDPGGARPGTGNRRGRPAPRLRTLLPGRHGPGPAGSGLGLAIVQQVVTTHGGTVAALSPPGGGTLIRIQLPTVVENEPDSPDFPTFLEPEGEGRGADPLSPSPLAPDVEVLEPNPYGEPVSWHPDGPTASSGGTAGSTDIAPGNHTPPTAPPHDGRAPTDAPPHDGRAPTDAPPGDHTPAIDTRPGPTWAPVAPGRPRR